MLTHVSKSEDMICITRVEISSLQPKPVTELLHTIERRSTTLSAAPLFTSDVNEDEDNNSNGFGTKAWLFFSRLCTLFLPDSLLCYVGNNIKEEGGISESQANELRLVKQAWREKIALCVIMASSSLGFLFVCLVLPTYLVVERQQRPTWVALSLIERSLTIHYVSFCMMLPGKW